MLRDASEMGSMRLTRLSKIDQIRKEINLDVGMCVKMLGVQSFPMLESSIPPQNWFQRIEYIHLTWRTLEGEWIPFKLPNRVGEDSKITGILPYGRFHCRQWSRKVPNEIPVIQQASLLL